MVCPYNLARPGGVQGQVTGLARALRAGGHQVTVVAPDDRLTPGRHGDTVVVGHTVGVRANGSVAPVALGPAAAWRARRAVREAGAEVVHVHEPLAPVTGWGCLVGSPVPVVGTFHRSGESALYRALGPAARWAAGHLDARCAVSEEARRTAVGVVGGDFEVLFNGVEVERFTDAEPWPTDRPTVLFVGRHEERKGLGVLLEAFAAVPDPARLWVAGDGPLSAELRRRHPPSARLEWLGLLDDDQLAARMAGAQVLCAPSLGGESFGVVLVEAMAAGAVVVASDLPGYAAAAAGHAELVRPGDVAGLADALTGSLADAATGTGRGSPAARAGARAHAAGWSMAALAERYLALYRRLVAEEPSAGPASLGGP
jgi:phosphatidylinositol alpha-mannosyltransferase